MGFKRFVRRSGAAVLALISMLPVLMGTMAPVRGAVRDVTQLPSVSLVFGEQTWTRIDFDFTRHGGGAELLALPAAAYDRVLLFPFGIAQPGQQYEVELATRFTRDVNSMRKLATLQSLLDQLAARGKRVTVYIPGFFSTNQGSWIKGLQPERFRTRPSETRAGAGGGGAGAERPESFPERWYALLQWLRTTDGRPRCEIAIDGSGAEQSIDSCSAFAAAFATAWGFTVHTEGHPSPVSALCHLSSITTAWSVLESPQSSWNPPAPYSVDPERRAVLLSNDSGIGSPDGCYQPGQPIGAFGADHRRNYVPDWRVEGRVIYVPLHAIGRDGSPPGYWDN
jgi:hypothetical protein